MKLSPAPAPACPSTLRFPSRMGASHGLVAAALFNGESGLSTGRRGSPLFFFCLGPDQLSAFRGPDRQPDLLAAAARRNRRGNAISVLRVGRHGGVEQDGVAAFQR